MMGPGIVGVGSVVVSGLLGVCWSVPGGSRSRCRCQWSCDWWDVCDWWQYGGILRRVGRYGWVGCDDFYVIFSYIFEYGVVFKLNIEILSTVSKRRLLGLMVHYSTDSTVAEFELNWMIWGGVLYIRCVQLYYKWSMWILLSVWHHVSICEFVHDCVFGV